MAESVRAIRPFDDVPAPFIHRRAARPTAREWGRHAALLFLTALTATFSGVMLASTNVPEPTLAAPNHLLDYILYVPEFYLQYTGAFIHQAITQPGLLIQGVT
ncbi:MAG TPA: hypothetical protein VF634_08380, partial [Pyrinomonadaceae bacterium]